VLAASVFVAHAQIPVRNHIPAMTDRIDWDRLARYASGEADDVERADVDRWAAENSGNRAALESVRRGWAASAERTTWDVDGAWARLQPKLGDVTPDPTLLPFQRHAPRRSWFRASRLVSLAAAAALVFAVALEMRRDGETVPGSMALTAGTTFSTTVGEQRSFDLPDGSQVVLGAASSLRLAEGYGSGSREVFLEGRAFIRVVHDAASPFVVHAGGTRTVDLGTAFEVRAYPDEGVRVVVTEGSVEVQRDSGSSAPVAVLGEGDLAQIAADADAVILRNVDVGRLVGWTRGELTFDDTPLSAVAAELERWYDIDVDVEGEAIGALHLTTQVRIGESLDEVLRVVELTLSMHGVRAERDGRSVTFRAGPPAVPPARRTALRAEVGA
jgi:ferric-dicitrate binding protein FerR (iron transport regulator)